MLEFRHPLLRAAVYHTASAVARRAAHQALANTVAGERQLDRRAWHLAAAAPGHDDAAARALEEAAVAARRRGGHAEAASALDPARAAKMLTDAAWACFMAAEITSGLETAERANELGTRVGGIAETLAKAVLGIALVLSGNAQRAVPLFADYIGLLDSVESSP